MLWLCKWICGNSIWTLELELVIACVAVAARFPDMASIMMPLPPLLSRSADPYKR